MQIMNAKIKSKQIGEACKTSDWEESQALYRLFVLHDLNSRITMLLAKRNTHGIPEQHYCFRFRSVLQSLLYSNKLS